MIITCPGCGRRYKLDAARLKEGRRNLRCAGCGRVFAAEAAGGGAPADPAPERRAQAAPGGAAPLVLVGDESREFRDLVCRTLEDLGCRVEATDDGESALRIAGERRPRLSVLNVYLRKLLGVAVCEAIKGNRDLRAIRVALVGSVFKSERFMRAPRNLYGADDYFEDVIPVAEMRDRFSALLLGPGAASSRAGAAAGRAATPGRPGRSAAGTGGAGQAAGGATPSIEPRAEIRRLARIMLSDLRIYYPDRFDRAVAERRFFESFREELTKGKELIVSRFPDLPDRLEILAAALREGLQEARGVSARSAGGAP